MKPSKATIVDMSEEDLLGLKEKYSNFIPNNKEDAGKIGDEILNTIVKNLGKEYNERSNELFGGALQKKEEE